MRNRPHNLLQDTRGVSQMEHLIVVTLVGLAGIGGWQVYGQTLGNRLGMGDDGATGHSTSGSSVASALGTGGATDPSAPTGSDGDHDGVPDDTDGTGGTSGDGGAGATEDIWGEGGALGRGDSTGIAAVGRGVADGAVDVIGGAIEGGIAMAGGVWDAVTNPTHTAAVIGHAVTHPGETVDAAVNVASAVVDSVIESGTALVDACATGDGYACSRAVTNVVGNFIPVGAAGTVARGSRVVGNTSHVGVVARVVARVAPDPAAIERAWPRAWPAHPPGTRIISRQERLPTKSVSGSVQSEVRRDIVDAKKAEIQAILDGGPGELPQVKMIPDPDNPGGHILIDQNHTYEAYRELGFDEVPAQVYTNEGVDFLKEQLAYPNDPFPIGDMRTVDDFSGTPAQQAAARRAAQGGTGDALPEATPNPTPTLGGDGPSVD